MFEAVRRPLRATVAAMLTSFAIGLAPLPAAAEPRSITAPAASSDGAENAIRDALNTWTRDFNAGNADGACALFAPDLRFDYRGQPERGYDAMCAQLKRSVADSTKRYSYAPPAIKEIIVSGDLATVWLVWTLTVTRGGQEIVTKESSMDVFRRQPDGQWKIVRFLAYED
jgi:steroid delta-isomerase